MIFQLRMSMYHLYVRETILKRYDEIEEEESETCF